MKKLLVCLLVSLSLAAPAAAYNAEEAEILQATYGEAGRNNLMEASLKEAFNEYADLGWFLTSLEGCTKKPVQLGSFAQKEAARMYQHEQLDAMVTTLAAIDGVTDESGDDAIRSYKTIYMSVVLKNLTDEGRKYMKKMPKSERIKNCRELNIPMVNSKGR